MSVETKLRSLLKIVLEEAKINTSFAAQLEEVLGEVPAKTRAPKASTTSAAKSKKSRAPAKLDPYAIYEHGLEALREHLQSCSEEELKDIIAQYGLDAYGTALRLRKREKLEKVILDIVPSRATKGDAFMAENGASAS